MTPQVLAKQANELLAMYRDLYKYKTGKSPLLNIAKEKWAARELIESFGLDECKGALDWYFKVNKKYEWKTFVYVCDQCITESKSVAKDKELRRKYRTIANEWRNS
jgi:hypothetical protein